MMITNIAVILSTLCLAVLLTDSYMMIDKWIDNKKFYKKIKARQREIRRLNTENTINLFAIKIAENYKMNNALELPDKRKLARMIKREYDQAKDYGLIDDMGNYSGDFIREA